MSITEEEVLRVLEFLRENGIKAAQARANRLHLEQWLKSKKALLMKQSAGQSVAAAEMEALAHPEYLEALEGFKAAIEADEKYRWWQEAAQAKLDVFRTLQANERAARP